MSSLPESHILLGQKTLLAAKQEAFVATCLCMPNHSEQVLGGQLFLELPEIQLIHGIHVQQRMGWCLWHWMFCYSKQTLQ